MKQLGRIYLNCLFVCCVDELLQLKVVAPTPPTLIPKKSFTTLPLGPAWEKWTSFLVVFRDKIPK